MDNIFDKKRKTTMNTKQVKRMRKELKYNPNDKKSEEQKNLKKAYKALKKDYKTVSQVRQETLNARHVARHEIETAESAELLAARQKRQKEKKAKKLANPVVPNELMIAGAERRQKHAETQKMLEANERAIRAELNQKEEEKYLEWAKEEMEKKTARRKNLEELKKNRTPVDTTPTK
jgi:hypothetical protein